MSGVYTNGATLAVPPFTGNEQLPLDTNLGQGANPEFEAATLSQLAGYLNGAVPPWVHGRFYGPPPGASGTTLLTVLGTIYAYPIYVPNAVTVASASVSVTTGQTGGKVRAGIYADNGAGYPGSLVTNSDTGDLTATGTAVVGSSAQTIALNAGWYWLAVQATASSTMPTVEAVSALYTNALSNQLGSDTAAHALAFSGEATTGINATGQTYGAMPLTFPTGATLTLNAATPAVALGV